MKSRSLLVFLLFFVLLSVKLTVVGQTPLPVFNDSTTLLILKSPNTNDTVYQPVQVSILPTLGTSTKVPGYLITDYSFNILGGETNGARKMELALLFNIDHGNMSYFQYAGLFNLVDGNVNGLQWGGLVNIDAGNFRGFQFGGIGNSVKGNVDGMQIGGIYNLNYKKTNAFQVSGILNVNQDTSCGFQIAGIFNSDLHQYTGMQVAGIMNSNTENSSGAQIAGLGNSVMGNYTGAQIAGLYNVVADTLRGSQIAGLVNVGNVICGSQIGVFNISDSINGIPVGFFSYSRSGYHKMELSANDIFPVNVSFLTGVEAFHNIFTAGMQPNNGGKILWSFGYGIGSNFRLGSKTSLVLDVTCNQVSEGEFLNELDLLNKGFLGINIKLNKRISLTTGPELNVWLTDTNYSNYPDLVSEINSNVFYHETFPEDHLDLKMWIGWKLGMRFF